MVRATDPAEQVDCALSFVYVEYASTTIYRLHKAGRIQDVLRAKIEGTIIDSLVKMMKHRDAFVAAISIVSPSRCGPLLVMF